jgi:hypothetical protein
MYTTRRGLGTLLKTDPDTGVTVDCDDWTNMLNLTCWTPTVLNPLVTGPYAGDTPGSNAGDPSAPAACGILDLFNGNTDCTNSASSLLASVAEVALIGGGILVFIMVLGAFKR